MITTSKIVNFMHRHSNFEKVNKYILAKITYQNQHKQFNMNINASNTKLMILPNSQKTSIDIKGNPIELYEKTNFK